MKTGIRRQRIKNWFFLYFSYQQKISVQNSFENSSCIELFLYFCIALVRFVGKMNDNVAKVQFNARCDVINFRLVYSVENAIYTSQKSPTNFKGAAVFDYFRLSHCRSLYTLLKVDIEFKLAEILRKPWNILNTFKH